MCGIFGVYNAKKAAELTVIGLHGNQHRAIDYAGIVTSDGRNLHRERGLGLARQVFDKVTLNRLHGMHAVGHIRYPTVTDDAHRDNIQPLLGVYGRGQIALAHNGNLTNRAELEQLLITPILATSIESELILRLLEERQTGDIVADLTRIFSLLKGSYCLGILLPDRLIAVRDRSGSHPLSIGMQNGSHFISSETVAFGGLDASFVRDVESGEMVVIDQEGMHMHRFADKAEKKCRFEGNYFSHPSSTVFGEPVAEYRRILGRALEEHCPAHGADIVAPVPDSSIFIARGYAESGRSGKYNPVIVRSHYVGRTFIAATQAKRDEEVAQKFSFTPPDIAGKKIVVVDDSIVRGTTLPIIVRKLREYGAHEVHLRIASPPIMHPCLYGINTPDRGKLISAQLPAAHICSAIGADSLLFLPLEVQRKISPNPESFCFACMDGKYWH